MYLKLHGLQRTGGEGAYRVDSMTITALFGEPDDPRLSDHMYGRDRIQELVPIA